MAQKTKNTHGVVKNECQMTTPPFRVSYPHLFKPQGIKGAVEKYSITMLFPKDKEIAGYFLNDGVEEPRTLKGIIAKAKTMAFGPKENWPTGIKSPVVDGDLPKYEKNEGYKGHWVIKATSNADTKPTLLNIDGEAITDPADFYPGCYAEAFIFARVWEHETGGTGVQFIVDHVRKTADGKTFGGKMSASSVFKPHSRKADVDVEEMDEEQF